MDNETTPDNRPTEGANAGLAQMPTDSEAEVRAQLSRVMSGLLIKDDMGSALTRDLAGAGMNLPSLALIDSLAADSGAAPTLEGIERLLAGDEQGVIYQGIRLNDLLARGGAAAEERALLNRGLKFLRQGMYTEAVEWWTLNRPDSPRENNSLYLILTLMLSLTHKIRGDEAAAQAELARARASDYFSKRKE